MLNSEMANKLTGTPEEIRAKAEEIIRTIHPTARCELHDHEQRIRCGVLDCDGAKNEFSLLIGKVDRALLEAYARTLKANLR